MPQMSPLLWPLIYLILMYLMSTVNITLQKTFALATIVSSANFPLKSKTWKW